MAVHGIYHPPPSLRNKTTDLAFIEDFLEFASNTLPEHQNSIYIGDFNLHVSKEDANPAIFNDSIEAMGLYQHVGFHTHQGGNILDLIISDIRQQTTIVSTAPGPFLSDHHAIIGTLNVKKLKPSYAKIKVRQIHKITDSQWIDELDTNNLELTNKLDTLNKSLSTELMRVLDTLAPEKECKINLRTKRPWYDADLKEHKRQVRKLEKKWLKYKNEGCHTAFKKCRNSYYGKLNAKKKSVLQSKFQDCGKDSRKIHALMTNLTTKHCERKFPKSRSDQELAEEFATFFQDKIQKIRDKLNNKPHFQTNRNNAPSFRCFTPMMEDQVIKTVHSLKSKSCELDPIPTTIFKKLLDKLAPLITKIVNISLTKGEFSTDWKTAVVRPLLKKIGLELIHANFRLVSNLSFLSKLVEKCMLLQLSDHCKMFNLQPDYQSAYREDYSCETAVLGISNDILWAMEKQSITSLVALDLSAAFDTVDHNTLLHILNAKYGIEDTALKWFDEYLRPRAFKVTINGQYSKPRDLTVSVPQGSCAGANIFNLYCSPLQDVVPSSLQLSGFADDHSVRREFKARDREGESETICILEDCMLRIKQWMDETRLKMNTAKTEFIYFGNQCQLDKCRADTIDVAGDLILRTNSIKYLGVQMDSNLNFKQHITQKCRSAMFNFLRIKSIRHLLDEDTTESLCLSLCISHLDYCNSLLYGLPDTSIAKIAKNTKHVCMLSVKKIQI